jgi:hypothetical protein
MTSKFEYQLLEKSDNFYLASEILECFKNRITPAVSLLERLYGKNKALAINTQVKNFFDENVLPSYKKPRQHDVNSPAEIFNARQELEEDKNYLSVQSALLDYQVPDLKSLSSLYGPYSEYIREIFSKFIGYRLKRKCELPAVAHLNRVGGVSIKLNFNLPGCYEYGAIAAIHDAIEDLFPIIDDENKKKYDFSRYKEFLDKFIPKNLQMPIKILTNHYNLILSTIISKLKEKDKAIKKKNIINQLEILLVEKLDELDEYIRKMHDVLYKEDLDKEKDIIEYIKLKCYNELYLNGITKSSIESGDYRIFEIKGVDLSDNSHGKDALPLDGRIRNIKKNVNWANYGYGLHSTWVPLNNHIRECMEDSFNSAEILIIKDLLQPQSSMDFVKSSLIIFSELENVFYVTEDPDNKESAA